MLRKIDRMHEQFGVIPSKTCKDCMHLKGGANEYKKCEIYGNTRAESTDWTMRWTACGMFNREWDGDIPIVRLNKGGVKKEETQIDGQMSLFDGGEYVRKV